MKCRTQYTFKNVFFFLNAGLNFLFCLLIYRMLEGNPWGADVTESKWHWYVLFKLQGGAYKCCVTLYTIHSLPSS